MENWRPLPPVTAIWTGPRYQPLRSGKLIGLTRTAPLPTTVLVWKSMPLALLIATPPGPTTCTMNSTGAVDGAPPTHRPPVRTRSTPVHVVDPVLLTGLYSTYTRVALGSVLTSNRT